MKFLFELAKLIAKKSANLGKRKKDEFGDPLTRRFGEDIEVSFGSGTPPNPELKKLILNIHKRNEYNKVKQLGRDRRKEERRKPPESSGNGN
tara:strand:- start:288 stop:563 length:276 start_codon:yes stop_codon:yes gene_type:complete